ncbi:MAG: 2,3-diphosphoglycerate-dependent phosphoglycerate mutase [Patescibacteria group bacterium]
MGLLVLVRHGESRWNEENKFTGWVDVPLSDRGIDEAERCAVHCRKYDFDQAFTSRLERAQDTLQIILSDQGRTGIVQHVGINPMYRPWIKQSNKFDGDLPVHTSEDLNERYYGSLQGMDKLDAEKRFGKENVFLWRRGYTEQPPKGESLRQAFERIMPYFKRHVFPRVKRGDHVLIVAHGNTLRAVIKHLEKLNGEEIADIDFPEARPIVYRYSKSGWKRIEGEYQKNRPLR